MELSLVTKRLTVTISDPWEFGTECGVGPFAGRIEDLENTRLLLKLNYPICFRKVNLLSAISQLRYVNSSFDDLLLGRSLATNLVLLPISPRTLNEISAEEFRRGIAAVGTVKLADAQ